MSPSYLAIPSRFPLLVHIPSRYEAMEEQTGVYPDVEDADSYLAGGLVLESPRVSRCCSSQRVGIVVVE